MIILEEEKLKTILSTKKGTFFFKVCIFYILYIIFKLKSVEIYI